jgi:parallel beta-helix repeat protein
MKRIGSGIMLTLLLIAMLMLAFNIQSVKTEFRTITVPDDYLTIQEAINYANERDTIFVRNGTYYENVIVNKTLSLIGENKDTTIVNGTLGGEGNPVVRITVSNVTLNGFTFCNSDGMGVIIEEANNTQIINNEVKEVKGIGVWSIDSFNCSFIGNVVRSVQGYEHGTTDGIMMKGTGFASSADLGGFMRNNSFIGSYWNFQFAQGRLFRQWDIDTSNLADGKPIYYLVNKSHIQVPNDVGTVIATCSKNITIRDVELRNNGAGIDFFNVTESKIENVTVHDCVHGITEGYGDQNIIENNTIINNDYGLTLLNTKNDTLRMNNMSSNTFNFGVHNTHGDMTYSIQKIDETNLVNNKPIHYMFNVKDLEINSSTFDFGYLAIINSTNIILKGLNLTSNYFGLTVAFSANITITQCNFTYNLANLWLQSTNFTEVYSNRMEGFNNYGLPFPSEIGIGSYRCSSNSYFANHIEKCADGFLFQRDTNITCYENQIINCYEVFYVWMGNNIEMHHNNFMGSFTEPQGYSYESTLELNSSYPSGGNYWSDYTGADLYMGPYQNETGSDGIGDTPYIIDGNNKDNYPLMGPSGPLTLEGENATVFPIDDVGLIFENVAVEGSTIVSKTETGPEPPSGFKLAGQYYGVETTASYSGNITIRIIYEDSDMTQEEEESLQLMQWNETLQQWIDITTYVDVENNVIYGETTHLSMFAIMESYNVPQHPPPANIGGGIYKLC